MFCIKTPPGREKIYMLGICRDGLILGEKQDLWVVNKTFITRDFTRPDQDKAEAGLINLLYKDINTGMNDEVEALVGAD